MNAALRERWSVVAETRAQAHPVQVEAALRRGMRAYLLRVLLTYLVGVALVAAVAAGGLVLRGAWAGSAAPLLLSASEIGLEVGQEQRLTVSRASGEPVSGSVRWRSADPSVAQVDGSGVVTARAVGATTITVLVGEASASAAVSVTAGTVVPSEGIEVAPGQSSLQVGQEQRLTVSRASGEPVSGSVRWRSADPSVAQVDGSGVVTARAVGATTITVLVGEASASAAVSVTAGTVVPSEGIEVAPGQSSLQVGQEQRLTVSRASGEPVSGSVRWRSADPSVAQVDGSGVVTARAVGATTITVLVGEASASAAVSVTAGTVVPSEGIEVAPGQSSLQVGQEQRLTVSRASGEPVSGSVRWRSADPSVAQVDGSGVVTARAVGATTITVLVGEASASAAVSVTAGTVVPSEGIEVAPGQSSLQVGQEQRLTVSRASGEPVSGSVRWRSADPSVAQVDGSGVVTARAVGATTITVLVGEASASAAVSVTEPPIRGISVSPTEVTTCWQFQSGHQLKALATYGDGTRTDVTRSVTWSSDDESIAVVDPRGLVTFESPGGTTVRATLQDAQGTAAVLAEVCVE